MCNLFGDNDSYLKKITERLIKFPGGLVIVEIEVGQVELQIKQFENKEIGYVNLFYLISEYRGKVYGVKLIEFAERLFREYGVNAYQLRVSPTNKRAISFYQKSGFDVLQIEDEDTVPRFKLTGASYYKVSQFLLVDLFLIDSIISVARVGRTGAWDMIP